MKVLAEDNGDLFPIYFMYESFIEVTKNIIGKSVNNCMHHGKNHVWEAIFDSENWDELGEAIYDRLKKNKNFIELIKEKILTGCKNMIEASEKVHNAELDKLSNKELWDLFQNYREKNKQMYGWGIIPSFVEFGVPKLSRDVREIIRKKAGNERILADYFVILTTPDEETFLTLENKSLFRITADILENQEAKELFRKNIEEIEKGILRFPELNNKIEKHTEEYGAAGYIYLGPAWKKEHYLEQLKNIIEKGIDPEKKLFAIEKRNEINKKKKRQLLNQLGFTESELHLINCLNIVGFIKLYRKDLLYKSYYHMHKWLEEVCKRFDLEIKQLRHMIPDEIGAMLLEGKRIDKKILDERIKFYCFILQDDKLRLLYGKEAREFYEKNVEKIEVSDINELKGECACQGKVTGIIKLIRTVEDMQKMEKGDILISPATNPNLVPAMEKAGAIVTDEGGITCHAAIVSREMGIPCVTGTNIVTKAFKDGDKVEVDATNGIVKRLK
jgi:phosphohistidine swiveling domain-containing protein